MQLCGVCVCGGLLFLFCTLFSLGPAVGSRFACRLPAALSYSSPLTRAMAEPIVSTRDAICWVNWKGLVDLFHGDTEAATKYARELPSRRKCTHDPPEHWVPSTTLYACEFTIVDRYWATALNGLEAACCRCWARDETVCVHCKQTFHHGPIGAAAVVPPLCVLVRVGLIL